LQACIYIVADLRAKANDLKHAITMLYVNKQGTRRMVQLLLTGLRIYVSGPSLCY
jgi:hypothetical protein